ncbi:glutathione S-transferase N-terminal domain-containing protein [Pseudaminobacter salicylatoxidans]|uniref:glutathione S-transferase N-terminal domain-containing protein n=1 Tax=Pseudaminobacter salicylatoxidans TaxID=93369 RepID=UPI0002D720BC|nr:glutathione S-transferase N-terminal domain-containing protein [Pseudaminobacter salicylatoxidans]
MMKMRLLGSPTSPYVRKVRVLIHEAGLEGDMVFDRIAPRDRDNDLREHNPLGRVPAFVVGEGPGLFESSLICDWICQELPAASSFLPRQRRWAVLTTQALADGLLEAGLLMRHESLRPDHEQSPDWIARQLERVCDGVDGLSRNMAWSQGEPDLGQIAVACALGWLGFRFPDVGWMTEGSDLAGWYRAFAMRQSMVSTAPDLS